MSEIVNYKDINLNNYSIWSNYENKVIILEPCPFCGHKKPILNADPYGAFGWCPKCNARGGQHYDEKVAIELWNNRK